MTVERAARNAARSLRRTPEAVVREAGGAVKKELDRLAKSELGSDQRMSNLKNVRVSAKVTVTRFGRGAIADVEPSTPRARSPWRWLTDGTKAHEVPRNLRRFRGDASGGRDTRGRTFGKRARMQVKGQWATGPWRVRGVPGKDLWWRARPSKDIRQAAVEAFEEELRRGR